MFVCIGILIFIAKKIFICYNMGDLGDKMKLYVLGTGHATVLNNYNTCFCINFVNVKVDVF